MLSCRLQVKVSKNDFETVILREKNCVKVPILVNQQENHLTLFSFRLCLNKKNVKTCPYYEKCNEYQEKLDLVMNKQGNLEERGSQV